MCYEENSALTVKYRQTNLRRRKNRGDCLLLAQILFSLMSECPVLSASKHIFHGKWHFGRSMWFSYKPIKRTNATGKTKSIYILESAGN